MFIQKYSEQSNPANTDTEGTIESVHIKQAECRNFKGLLFLGTKQTLCNKEVSARFDCMGVASP